MDQPTPNPPGFVPIVTERLEVPGAASRFIALARCAMPEHEHGDAQLTIPFSRGGVSARWHTGAGANRRRTIRPGECGVVPSGQPHRFNWEGPAELVCLYLSAGLVARAADEVRARGDLHLPGDYHCQDPVVLQLGTTLREEYALPGGAPPRLLLEGAAAVAVLRLLRRRATGRTVPVRTWKLDPHTLRRALDHIHAHLDEDLSLADIAAAARYSPFHFARAFKAAVGLPPHRYVTQERIERAKRRLRGGETAIGQISLECGFRDQSHFTRLFRRLTGMTPRHYRTAAKP